MSDLYHVSGYDITLSESGDVGNVTGVEFSQQRVLRRLATNTGAYIFALQYGAGLSGRIGYGRHFCGSGFPDHGAACEGSICCSISSP
ncbi:MAG: hypothetical protein SOH81_11630 [Acetobacter sp.]